MANSQYAVVFRDELRRWEKDLSIVFECIDVWQVVQRKWMYLEGRILCAIVWFFFWVFSSQASFWVVTSKPNSPNQPLHLSAWTLSLRRFWQPRPKLPMFGTHAALMAVLKTWRRSLQLSTNAKRVSGNQMLPNLACIDTDFGLLMQWLPWKQAKRLQSVFLHFRRRVAVSARKPWSGCFAASHVEDVWQLQRVASGKTGKTSRWNDIRRGRRLWFPDACTWCVIHFIYSLKHIFFLISWGTCRSLDARCWSWNAKDSPGLFSTKICRFIGSKFVQATSKEAVYKYADAKRVDWIRANLGSRFLFRWLYSGVWLFFAYRHGGLGWFANLVDVGGGGRISQSGNRQ